MQSTLGPCFGQRLNPCLGNRTRSLFINANTSHRQLRRWTNSQPQLLPQDASCGSTGACTIAIISQPDQPQPHQLLPVVEVLQRCRNAFICIAACAAWGFLSSGSPGASPFASLALSSSEGSLSGALCFMTCDMAAPCATSTPMHANCSSWFALNPCQHRRADSHEECMDRVSSWCAAHAVWT